MIWEMTLDYLKACQIEKVDVYGPIYLMAVGSHIANYHNKGHIHKAPFYTHHGTIPDLRNHPFIVAPPGWGKTLYIRAFTDKRLGLLQGAIPCINEQSITNKGLIGGFDRDKTGLIRVYGEAELHRTAIFGVDEYSHFETAGKSDHSAGLMNSMLDLLDSGYVRYRPGTPEAVEFDSYMTLFAGTQTERFGVEEGMARRITLIDLTPDIEMVEAYKKAYRRGRNVEPNMDLIGKIREEIRFLWNNFDLNRIIFHDSYLEMCDNLAEDHIEQGFFDKIAIGYRVIRYYRGERTLDLMYDPDLEKLMKNLKIMRENSLGGVSDLSVMKILKKGPMSLTELKRRMCHLLHVDWSKAEAILDRLTYRRRITKTEVKTSAKKPTTFVTLNTEQEWR